MKLIPQVAGAQALPKTARILNHEPMTEEKLKNLVQHHTSRISPQQRHDDPVVYVFHLRSSINDVTQFWTSSLHFLFSYKAYILPSQNP